MSCNTWNCKKIINFQHSSLKVISSVKYAFVSINTVIHSEAIVNIQYHSEVIVMLTMFARVRWFFPYWEIAQSIVVNDDDSSSFLLLHIFFCTQWFSIFVPCLAKLFLVCAFINILIVNILIYSIFFNPVFSSLFDRNFDVFGQKHSYCDIIDSYYMVK